MCYNAFRTIRFIRFVLNVSFQQLEVLAFPGHSKGSLTFIEKRDDIVFVGDSILFRILIDRGHIAEYIRSLDRFMEKTEGIGQIIKGHQTDLFARKDAFDLRECAIDIISGKAQGKPYELLGGWWMLYQRGKMRIAVTDG